MFRTSLLALALAAVALCSLNQSIQAQVTQIPNSGCLPNPPYPSTNNVTGIGQRLLVKCPPCGQNLQGMVIIGVTARPPVLFYDVLTCTQPPNDFCWLVCQPIQILFPADGWRIDIPLNPRLIGSCVCVQCGCVSLRRECLTLSGALRICITAR